MKNIAQKAMNLEDGGTVFYEFADISDEKAFKDQYRQAMNELPIDQETGHVPRPLSSRRTRGHRVVMPFLRELPRPGGRRPGSSPEGASQLRDSAGISPDFALAPRWCGDLAGARRSRALVMLGGFASGALGPPRRSATSIPTLGADGPSPRRWARGSPARIRTDRVAP